MTDDEIRAQIERDNAKSFSEKSSEFFSGVGQGMFQLARLGAQGISELGGAVSEGDFSRIGKTGAEGVARAMFDIADLGEAIAGRVGDVFVSDEEAIERQIKRRREDILDQEKRRQGLLFSEEEILPAATEVGSFVLDPTNLIGVGAAGKVGKLAGLGVKAQNALDAPNKLVRAGLEKGARLTAGVAGKTLTGAASVLDKPLGVTSSVLNAGGKVAGLPRDAVNTMLQKTLGTNIDTIRGITGVGGALTNPVTQTELLLKAGGNAAGGAGTVLKDAGIIMNILSDKDRQFRFLKQAMSADSGVSQKTRNLLKVAGTGTQKGLDLAFNALANGTSTAVLQGLMAKAATDDPEAIGSAVGMGLLFGGALPVGPSNLRNTGSDRAFWDLQNQLAQSRALEKLSPSDRAILGNMSLGGYDSMVVPFDKQTYRDHFIADNGTAPKNKAAWEDSEGTIFFNTESPKAVDQLIPKIGVRVARDLVDQNPQLKQNIAQELNPDGNLDNNAIVDLWVENSLGDLFTGKASSSKIKSSLSENPATLDLIDGVMRNVMSKLGLVDGATGAPTEFLSKAGKNVLKNKGIKNAFDNFNLIKDTSMRVRENALKKESRRISKEQRKIEARERFAKSQEQARQAAQERQDKAEEALVNKDDIIAARIQREQDKYEYNISGDRIKEGRKFKRNKDTAAKEKLMDDIKAAIELNEGFGTVGLGQGNEGVVLGNIADVLTGEFKDNAIALQDAITSNREIFVRGVLTGQQGGSIEPYNNLVRILQIQAPKGKGGGTALNYQFIDTSNASIRAQLPKEIIDAQAIQLQNAVKAMGGRLSDVVNMPEMQNNVVAQMVRDDLGKGDRDKTRVFKSIDPRNISQIRQ